MIDSEKSPASQTTTAPAPSRATVYDAFVSNSRKDWSQVEILASRLANEAGLRIWLDQARLRPGFSWRNEIETAMSEAAAALIVWGPHGLGPVQRQERDLAYAIRDARPDFRVIHAFLPSSPPPRGTWANAETWVRFESGLDESDPFTHLVAALKREAPPSPLLAELPDEPAPYRGLAAFGVEDASIFFGRSAYLEEMLERLPHHPFLAVVGPSGSGKTSLVQAGLLAHLKMGALPGSAAWPRLVMRPGPHPSRSLALSLARLQPQMSVLEAAEDMLQRVRANPAGLPDIVQALLPAEGRLVLVVDRLEELFTLCEVEEERHCFLAALLSLAGHPHRPAWVVATMRADFYDRVGRYADLVSELVSHQVYLGPIEGEQVAEIIEAPAAAVGAVFEKGLAVQVRTDAEAQGELVLPPLEHTLDLLWRKRRGRWLTWDAYHEAGGLAGALSFHADRVIDGLNSDEQEVARRLFLHLIWLDETTGTMAGRRMAKTALVRPPPHAETDERVLQRLADDRLVVLRGERRPASAELIHDTLPLHWDRLRGWMQADREFVLWRQRLRADLAEWERTERDPDTLLRGAPLAEAERWLSERADDLNQAERDCVQDSVALREGERAARAQERAARERLRRRITLAALVTAVMGVLLAAIAGSQWWWAEEQRRIVLSRQLAAQALAQVDNHFDLALLLGLEANRIADGLEANRVADTVGARGSLLYGLIANFRLTGFLRGHSADVTGVAFNPDGARVASGGEDGTLVLWDVAARRLIYEVSPGRGRSVNGVAVSPDGRTLASGGSDRKVTLWDATSGQIIGELLPGHNGSVNAVAFSPDGRTLASGGADRKVIVWDLASREALDPPLTHDGEVLSVAFSRDGTRLVSGSRANTVTLWDISTGQTIVPPLAGHEGPVQSVAFSPDGTSLVSGSEDGTVIVWDVAIDQPVGRSLTGHTDQVRAVAFSPDGKTLVSGGRDEVVIVWEPATGQPIGQPLTGHTRGVLSIAFSPDGARLASGGRDATVILWDLAARHALIGHPDAVNSVAFSRDGQTLASGGEDGTVVLWNVATGQRIGQPLAGHTRGVLSVAFNPDGTKLASGARDRTVILWDIATGQASGQPLDSHGNSVKSVVFSPDGRLLVSGARDGKVILRDAATGASIGRSLEAPGDALFSVAFSPDSTMLASGSREGAVVLWDVATRRRIDPPLMGHSDAVNSVAFSPDGRTLASGSGDDTIILWDVASHKVLGPPLTDHRSAVESVAFSPDGKMLASGSKDNTLILWDVAARLSLGRPLTGHTRSLSSVVFSPDGETLASGSADNSVRLWPVSFESRSERACAIVARNLTPGEWRQYLGDEPYRKTCPELP